MSDITKLAHVLREYDAFRKGPTKKGGGDFHKGVDPSPKCGSRQGRRE